MFFYILSLYTVFLFKLYIIILYIINYNFISALIKFHIIVDSFDCFLTIYSFFYMNIDHFDTKFC